MVDPTGPGAQPVGETGVEIAVLTARFLARPGAEEALLAALSRYVVLTRHEPTCRNVDLVASVTEAGRFLVIEKWESAAAVQAHLDSRLMADMAQAALAAIASKPDIDLYDSISAHDLE
ncbi:MAG: putative quinol monooxygenase [Solirubrobacteraceae bacterium]